MGSPCQLQKPHSARDFRAGDMFLNYVFLLYPDTLGFRSLAFVPGPDPRIRSTRTLLCTAQEHKRVQWLCAGVQKYDAHSIYRDKTAHILVAGRSLLYKRYSHSQVEQDLNSVHIFFSDQAVISQSRNNKHNAF